MAAPSLWSMEQEDHEFQVNLSDLQRRREKRERKGRGGKRGEKRGKKEERRERRREGRRKERERKVGEKTGKRLCACAQCGPAWFTTQDPDPVLTVQPMPVSSQLETAGSI